MILTPILISVAMLQPAKREWVGQDGSWRADAAASLDALSIVVPTRINEPTLRRGPKGALVELESEDAVVVNSVFARVGTTIHIIVGAQPPGMHMMPIGQKCLVLARRVHNSNLEWPLSSATGSLPDFKIKAESKDEVTGVAWFVTSKDKLDGATPDPRTLTQSILSTLDGASNDDTERTCTYLLNSFFPGFTVTGLTGKENESSLRLLRLEKSAENPYRREMIASVRNYWQIEGTDREVQDALSECATDKSAFPRGESVFLSVAGLSPVIDESGRQVPQPWESLRWANVVDSATNTPVLHFFLRNLPITLDDAAEKIVARRLSDTDPETRFLVARHLAKRYSVPSGAPTVTKDRQDKDTYPDLESKVQFWKAKFKIS